MLEEEDLREVARIALSGEIDMESVDEISAPIFGALDREPPVRLTVDCSGVTFIDSRGLNMMARAQRIADEGGRHLEWLDPPPRMLHLIGLTGLSDYLAISITT